jgi:hypothetical protein
LDEERTVKRWLRGPDDNGEPIVEVVDGEEQSWQAGARPQRSIMAEVMGEEGARRFQTADGRWLFPGTPP